MGSGEDGLRKWEDLAVWILTPATLRRVNYMVELGWASMGWYRGLPLRVIISLVPQLASCKLEIGRDVFEVHLYKVRLAFPQSTADSKERKLPLFRIEGI